MKRLITLVLLTLISGCTHSLYGAKFTELNNNGDNKDFLFYWTKTAPLLGKNTAGPGILVEQCSGSKYTFVESDDGIKMTAASGDFIPLSPQISDILVCGKIAGTDSWVNYKEGDSLQLSILCNVVVDTFSKRTILAPRLTPYQMAPVLLDDDLTMTAKGALKPAPLTCP